MTPGAARAFASIAALALFLAGTAPAEEAPRRETGKRPPRSPVKVFILAGQSNMEGYGAVHEVDGDGKERKGTLTSLVNDPAKAPMFRHLRDTEGHGPEPRGVGIPATNDGFGDPAPNIAKKLTVEYTLGGKKHAETVNEGEELALPAGVEPQNIERALYGDLPDGPRKDVTEKLGKLIAAARARERWKVRDDVWVWFNGRSGPLTVGFGAGQNLFGPELEFGHVVGDALPEQVLIIKTAWGGQSLYRDFRPPSSGGETGARYRSLLETVRRVLAGLKEEFPGYDGGGHELAGLIWWHGWNDGCDPQNAVPEYEENLVHLIHDLRKDLEVPKLPVVIGELTGPWVEVGGEWGALRRAQAAAAARPELAGTVAFAETHDFVRREEDSPGGWPCHEFNNAETYFLVGDALGKRMVELLRKPRAAAGSEPPKPTAHIAREIEGWNVLVDDRLLQPPNDDLGARALRFLESRLADINAVVPREPLLKLRAVTIVLDLTHGKLRSMQYHPDAGWLKANGYSASLEKCVHIPEAADLTTPRNIREQPWVVLHELAHAYHDQVLGFDEPRIRAAYERYKRSGRGDAALLHDGTRAPHYGLTDEKEFFAEMTESYFGMDDFFPFNRAELMTAEPEIHELMKSIWEPRPAEARAGQAPDPREQ